MSATKPTDHTDATLGPLSQLGAREALATHRVADSIIATYRNLGWLLAPAAGLIVDRRVRRGKEDPARRAERFGRASAPRPHGSVVWVHAASVGETVSALPLIDWLIGHGSRVVLTTGTLTSAAIAATRLPVGAVHQFGPLDMPPFLDRFLDHWRPSLALFVESEIWPATIVALQRRAIPQVLINGRLSERSERRWSRAGALARSLFQRLSLVLAQSEADAERFRQLGARAVEVTGNIKFDSLPLGADAGELARLQAQFHGRRIWLAASTHPGEEAMVATAAAMMAERIPDLLTIIAPRHPVRRADVEAQLIAAGLKVSVRSRGETPDAETAVYLADTMGELGLFYRLVPVAFIGGSLMPAIGGHNPIEAAQLTTAVLHGPHVSNARDVFSRLDREGGARQVLDAQDLAAQVEALLIDTDQARTIAQAAETIVLSGRGAIDRTRAALVAYLPAVLPAPATKRVASA